MGSKERTLFASTFAVSRNVLENIFGNVVRNIYLIARNQMDPEESDDEVLDEITTVTFF
jgi:hypothetical protein